MGFSWILAGFLLLINPIINVIDVLPDSLGFLLIAKGLTKIAYMNGKLEQARTAYLKLAILELVRELSLLLLPALDDTMLLLFVFVFGLLDLILFLPATADLFNGLNHLGLKFEGGAIFAQTEKKRERGTRVISHGTRLHRWTVGFFILRVVSSVLPELTALQMYEYLGTVSGFSVNYREYRPLFYILLSIVMVVVGIVWCVHLCRYFIGICKDKPFLAKLSEHYDGGIRTKTGMLIGKRMKTVLLLLIFAVIFSFTPYVDHINIFPGLISSAFLAVAALLMARYTKLSYWVIPVSVVRAALSIAGLLMQKVYFLDNRWGIVNSKGETAYHHITEAYEMLNGMCVLMILEDLIAVLSFVIFAVALMRTFKAHLAATDLPYESAQYSKEARDRDLTRIVGKKLIVNGILMFLHFALASGYLLLTLMLPLVPAFQAVIGILWILHTVYLVSATNELLYTPLANEEL